MSEKSVVDFNLRVEPEAEQEAIEQAERETNGLAKGENILKFLTIARGCEVLTNRAKRLAGSSKGKAYNKHLEQEKQAHPKLAEQMKGPQFSAAVWILRNWAIVLPYLEKMEPSTTLAV